MIMMFKFDCLDHDRASSRADARIRTGESRNLTQDFDME